MKLWTVLIIFFIRCSTEKNTDLMQSLSSSAVKSVKVTVTGKVTKGKISQARVDAYRLNADGTCNTSAGNLASTVTDSSGDYTFTYLKTGAPVCVIAVPYGSSKMYDEGTDTEIDWTGSTSLTMIMREPSSASKTGMNVTPFSRIISSRLAAIAKTNKGTAILDKQITYANKATAVMFGFTKGFTKALRSDSSVIDMDKIEDVFDSGINLNDSSSSKSKYANALLGAVSVAAGKTKKSTKLTSDDVEKYVAFLAEDIADGKADGTNSKGEALSVNGTAAGSTPLTGTLMTALTEYVNSKPSLGISSAEAAAVTFSQVSVFLQSIPSESNTTSSSFTIGGTVSSLAAGGLVLQNNAGDDLAVASGAAGFTFASSITGGAAYLVTIKTQPTGQICIISNGTGTANSNVTNISISCGSNGTVWTARTMPTSLNWQSVTFANGLFVAVPNGNTAATSPDGINWTLRTLPVSQSWYSVTYGNGVFVAVAIGPSSTAATSPDGITWTARTLPSSQNWYSVTYGNGLFVAVPNGSTAAATSPDGITWTARTLPSASTWFSVTYGNGIFVTVAQGSTAAATSPDGITWTARTLPSSLQWLSLTYGNGVFVTAGQSSSTAATSPDGITWTARTMPSSAGWRSLTYGNGIFAAVADGGSSAATSPDGINWTPRTMPSTSGWNSLTYGNGIFVTASYGPSTAAATSP